MGTNGATLSDRTTAERAPRRALGPAVAEAMIEESARRIAARLRGSYLALLLVGARHEAVMHMVGLAAAHALLDRRPDFGLIFRMDVLLKGGEGSVEAAAVPR